MISKNVFLLRRKNKIWLEFFLLLKIRAKIVILKNCKKKNFFNYNTFYLKSAWQKTKESHFLPSLYISLVLTFYLYVRDKFSFFFLCILSYSSLLSNNSNNFKTTSTIVNLDLFKTRWDCSTLKSMISEFL